MVNVIIFVISVLLGVCSVFAGFAPAYVSSLGGLSVSPTMYDYMFGAEDGSGRVPALTWLFCCELLIALFAIATLILYLVAKKKKDKRTVSLCGAAFMALLSLGGGITSFFTMEILSVSTGSGSIGSITASTKMGAGAIVMGIMLLLAFVGFVAYICLTLGKKQPAKKKKK